MENFLIKFPVFMDGNISESGHGAEGMAQ